MITKGFKRAILFATTLAVTTAQALPPGLIYLDENGSRVRSTNNLRIENPNWRERLAYRVLTQHDQKMLTVIEYCSQSGHCHSPYEINYLKNYLIKPNFNPDREMWEQGLDIMNKVGKGASIFGPQGAMIGEVVGPLTELAKAYPEVFDFSYNHWRKSMPTSNFDEVDLNASLTAIYRDPEVRSGFDELTRAVYNGDNSNDFTENPYVATFKRVNHLDQVTAQNQKSTEESLLGLENQVSNLLKSADSDKQEKRSIEEQRKKLSDFDQAKDDLSAAFTILSALVAPSNPKAAKMIDGIANASLKIMDTVKLAKLGNVLGKPSNLIMMANVVTAAFMVIQTVQESNAEQQFQQAVMEEFKMIHEQLAQISQKLDQMQISMDFNFSQIRDDLERLKQMQQQAQTDINQIKAQLITLDSHIRSYMQADKFSEWQEIRRGCLEMAGLRESRDSASQIDERAKKCFEKFYSVAVDHSKDDLFSESNQEFDSSNIISKLKETKVGQLNDLNFLLTALRNRKEEGLPVDQLPRRLPNVAIWSYGADTFSDINLTYFSNLKPTPKAIEDVASGGKELQSFFDRTMGSKDFQLKMARALQSKYDLLKQKIENVTLKMLAGTQNDPLPEQPKGQIRPHFPNNHGKTTPVDLHAAIPAQWFLAQRLGLGTLDMYYDHGPINSGQKFISLDGIRLPGFASEAQHVSVSITVEFHRKDGRVLPVLQLERISQNFGHPGALNRHEMPGPDEWLWESGAGEGLNGHSVEEPLHVNFVANAHPIGDAKAREEAFATIDTEVRGILKASIVAAMPRFLDKNFEGTVPGTVTIPQQYLDEIKNVYEDLYAEYKTFETLASASSYYTQGFSENCAKAIERAHPARFVEQFVKNQDILKPIHLDAAQPMRLLLYRHRRSQDLASRCYQATPMIDSIAKTNSKLKVLNKFTQTASNLNPAGTDTSCPSSGLKSWFCWLH